MLRKLALIVTALLLTSPAAHALSPPEISITNFVFSPKVLKFADPGVGVSVANYDGENHTVTTVLNNSGAPASDTVIPTGTTSAIMPSSGTWTYYCAPHPGMKKAKIEVPMNRTSPVMSVGETVSIYYGLPASTVPTGYDVDVQIKRPHKKKFQSYVTDDGDDSVGFQPLKPGLYRFRARTQNTTTGQATAYSPATSIQVYA